MGRELIRGARSVLVFTLLLGLGYPLLITAVSQVTMPGNADGSLIERDGEVIGSELIGQDFAGSAEYFQSRPSATGYAADATFFNNQGPNQRKLKRQIARARDAYLRREGRFTPGLAAAGIPADAVTTSASGVDPQISVEDARIQANRIASARDMSRALIVELIEEHTDDRGLGFLGNPAVDVLALNLALDEEDPP